MRFATVLVVLAAMALTGVARADLDEGEWAPDIEAGEWYNSDEPISLYECRGMVVVLLFWVSWHPGGEFVMPMANFVNSEFGRQQGVFMIGLTDAELYQVEEMLREERVLFPVGIASDAYKEYDIDNFPRAVIIDATGKIAWTGWPSGAELVSQIREVIAETPPNRTHPIEAAEARRSLSLAREALRTNELRKAYRNADIAYDRALAGDPLKADCQHMLDLIEALGRDELARAEAAVEDLDYTGAVNRFKKIKREFRGTDAAVAAGRRLRTIQSKYDEVADLLEQQQDEGVAENLLADTLALFRDRSFGEAYEKLQRIVDEFDSTPAADRARIVIERTEANPDVMLRVNDYLARTDCQSLLSQARAYERRGQPNLAKQKYQVILERYPDTVWADRARERLVRLRTPATSRRGS